MTGEGPGGPVSGAARLLYRAVLRLYPRRFRERYRERMLRAFRDRRAAARARRGRLGLAVETAALLVDGIRNGLAERHRPPFEPPAGSPTMSGLLHDLRGSGRAVLARPGVSAVIVVTLTLAIGANTLVFGVVHAVLLEPLPYPDPEGLVFIWEEHSRRGRDAVSVPNFRDWRRSVELAEGMALYEWWGLAYTDADEPVEITTLRATAGLLDVLGVAPALGRGFLPEEQRGGGARVVVVSHAFWRDRLEADPGVVGSTVRLDLEPYTVVGVLPAGFEFPPSATQQPQLHVPLGTDALAGSAGARRQRRFMAVARLTEGAGIDAFRREMEGIAASLAERYPETNDEWGISVESAHESLVVYGSRPTLLVLFGAVGLLLLIGCANVANLLTARLGTRRREIAVRAALGAGRGRIVRQVLLESLVLAAVGGGLGVAVAAAGAGWIRGAPAEHLPRLRAVDLDPAVLGVTLAACVVVAILFGLGPALRAARSDPMAGLREGSDGDGSSGPFLDVLVVAQVALTAMLLVGAGLLGKSLFSLATADPGFEPRDVVGAQLYLLEPLFPEDQDKARFYDDLLERVRGLPDVVSAGAASEVPLSYYGVGFTVPLESPDWNPSSVEDERRAVYRVVTPGYFETLGVRLLRGRTFTPADREDAPPRMVVNETLARRYFPSGAVLGARLSIPIGGEHEVVGVVADLLSDGLDRETRSELYIPMRQNPMSGMVLVARTRGDPQALVAGLRGAVAEIEPQQPIYTVLTMDELVAAALSLPRIAATLSGAFALLALVLACVGVYGVLAFAVSRQTREIGVRRALGARPGQTMLAVVRRGLWRVLLGGATGLLVALAASRAAAGVLYGIEAGDPAVFAAVAALLVALGLVAAWVPAWRAARVDPMVALREG